MIADPTKPAPHPLLIEAVRDGGYLVMRGGHPIFAGSTMRELLDYVAKHFNPPPVFAGGPVTWSDRANK